MVTHWFFKFFWLLLYICLFPLIFWWAQSLMVTRNRQCWWLYWFDMLNSRLHVKISSFLEGLFISHNFWVFFMMKLWNLILLWIYLMKFLVWIDEFNIFYQWAGSSVYHHLRLWSRLIIHIQFFEGWHSKPAGWICAQDYRMFHFFKIWFFADEKAAIILAVLQCFNFQ